MPGKLDGICSSGDCEDQAMNASILPHDEAPNAVARAWADLRDHLVGKARQLNDEVRRYPTPIAHCDEQLPKLLEERGRAVRQSRLAQEAYKTNEVASDRLRRLAQFIGASEPSDDDDVERALRKRLVDALAAALDGTEASPRA
jgi:hypothetical protein